MSFEHWLAFTAAAAVLLVIPGPTVLLVISYVLGHGRKPAAAIVAGVALGDLTAMTASMLGLGAVLASSAAIFAVFVGSVARISSISVSNSGVRRSCRRTLALCRVRAGTACLPTRTR